MKSRYLFIVAAAMTAMLVGTTVLESSSSASAISLSCPFEEYYYSCIMPDISLGLVQIPCYLGPVQVQCHLGPVQPPFQPTDLDQILPSEVGQSTLLINSAEERVQEVSINEHLQI